MAAKKINNEDELFDFSLKLVLKREIDVQQLWWYGYCLFKALSSLHKQDSKGYLIDFNLATDLHQKFGSTEKSKSNNDSSYSLPPTKSRKYISSKALKPVTHIKKKSDQIKMKSQGADGFGINSKKDTKSNSVPSTERLREPIPSTKSKELLNLVHEALQGPDHQLITSKRKRIDAPPTKLDNKKLIYE
ncbi:unnamed protein product [Lactuca saligna]|uniref:Uncharacterized protein n=1 Tax=Lactuca saligna TaxID=75948 RepID=A0AA35YAC0_LACSI|nr:unnamed protein product [Lactuca saligna]